MKYKPIYTKPIEAVQFTDIKSPPPMVYEQRYNNEYSYLAVKSKVGPIYVKVGDYIISSKDGKNFFPMDEELFERIYQKVEE